MIIRQAVRALLITPSSKILLIQSRKPLSGVTLWAPPGGGLEAEETIEMALRRELYEETGLNDFELGPVVWRRRHTFTWDGSQIDQQERYVLIPVSEFEPTTRYMPQDDEWGAFERFHWWPVSEILSSTALFVPRRLGILIQDLIQQGAPISPLDAGR